MLEFAILVIGVSDDRRAAAFWSGALGYVRRPPRYDGDDWIVLTPPGGAPGPHLAMDVSETPVQEHPRIHLDLHARDADDLRSEVERLLALGAQQVDWDLYPDDPAADNYGTYVVLADTEGNRFCVVDGSRA